MKLIIDIGCAFHKSYLKKLGTDEKKIIISFEPNPYLFNSIGKIVCNNKITKDRLYLHQLCIIDKPNATNSNKLYIQNENAASSTSKLVASNINKWKYPFGRPLFKTTNIIDVNHITLDDYLKYHSDIRIVNYDSIELLIIDIADNVLKLIDSFSNKIIKATKRFIVKGLNIDYKLFENQSDIVDIIDSLRTKGFSLIATYDYSRDQEQYLEFVNTNTIDLANNNNQETVLKRETDGSISIYC